MQKVIEGELDKLRKRARKFEHYFQKSRLLEYSRRIMNTPAPSGTATWTRGLKLRELLANDGLLDIPGLDFYQNYQNTNNTIIMTGQNEEPKPLWYIAHLDTISYLVTPSEDNSYPLKPYCYHLLEGEREVGAGILRFNLEEKVYETVGKGTIVNNEKGDPQLKVKSGFEAKPGDRVYIDSDSKYDENKDIIKGDLDNAASVVALAIAAPVLAELNIDAILAFPDEEEGPAGKGNQTFARGSRRLIDLFPAPQMSIVADLQENHGGTDLNSTGIGEGALLAESSSSGRGAVLPPHIYRVAELIGDKIASYGIDIQKSNGRYTSRSDDVSLFMKTPRILLMGVLGKNRHYDRGKPIASLADIAHLARAFIYYSIMPKVLEKAGLN